MYSGTSHGFQNAYKINAFLFLLQIDELEARNRNHIAY